MFTMCQERTGFYMHIYGSSYSQRPVVSMQNRLKHLESLVKGVMTSRPSNGPNDSTSNSHTSLPDFVSQLQNPTEIRGTFVEAPIYNKDGVSISSGQVVLGPNETTYVGATHWAAILDDVRFSHASAY